MTQTAALPAFNPEVTTSTYTPNRLNPGFAAACREGRYPVVPEPVRLALQALDHHEQMGRQIAPQAETPHGFIEAVIGSLLTGDLLDTTEFQRRAADA